MRKVEPFDKRLKERAKQEPFPLPETYAGKVRDTCAALKETNMKENKQKRSYRWLVGVAAALAVFVAIPNVSPAAAAAMEEIPVLGAVVRVITFRDYQYDDGHSTADVHVPELGGSGAADEINDQVQAYTDQLIAQFQTDCEAAGESYQGLDVIDFAAALYGLGKKEAAVQLAQDFGLSYEDWKPPGKAKKPKPRQKSPEEQFQEAKNRCFRILADYLHLLRVWRKEYAPHSPEEVFHPRFVEALQKQDYVEYLLDVLLFGETEEKADLITDYGKDVIQLEQRMAELAAADAARTKKHHERHAAAPER